MQKMLTRMLAFLTFAAYLTIGTVVARFYFADSSTFTISLNSLNKLYARPVQVAQIEIKNPEISFEKIQIEHELVEAKTPVKIAKSSAPQNTLKKLIPNDEKSFEVMTTTLPFDELIQLSSVIIENELPVNIAVNYVPFSYNEKSVVAEVKAEEKAEIDEVSTKLASNENAEPEFFAYENKEEKTGPIEPENKVVETDEKASVIPQQGSIDSFDYSKLKEESKRLDQPVAKTEEVSVANLLSFNHQQANQDISNSANQIASVNTQKLKKKIIKPKIVAQKKKVANAFMDTQINYPSEMSIQLTGVDFTKTEFLHGFEMRFQDTQQGIEDYGSGEVHFKAELSQPKMTRSVVFLKSGFVPTNTDLIIETGRTSVSVPVLENEKFNELNQEEGIEDGTGAIIVELDDETEIAQIDVPFKTVLKLNGDFLPTKKSDYRYLAFLGVKAGNSLLTYVKADGFKINKIIHVHENEMTFDANFYEQVINEKFQLFEEDLLGKQKSPLIISGESIKIFAKDESSRKVNGNTYKINFDTQHLGGRKYIELNHQLEPVFVGFRENTQLDIPSENFMRHILSQIDNDKLENRCLIQINLNKKTKNFDIGTESVNSSLATYTQVLETDGKFYDSVSDKSEKIIIVGENQASDAFSQNSKINIRIEFTDGTEQFLNSYCSPNTYLIEQL